MAPWTSRSSRVSRVGEGTSARPASEPTCRTRTSWSSSGPRSQSSLIDELAGTGLVVLADKPSGPTSHDLVARARREHGVKRVGHAGTLDPFATGLLIVLVGREATREQARFMSLRKTYRVTARF